MIVVDTSVAFKWFSLEEENRESALQLLDDHLTGKTPIMVPDLFFYELSNAWSTKTSLSHDKIHEYLVILELSKLTITPMTFALLTNAVNLSKKYHVSVYDASYAELAAEKKCNLITADKKFVQQVNLPYVKLLA